MVLNGCHKIWWKSKRRLGSTWWFFCEKTEAEEGIDLNEYDERSKTQSQLGAFVQSNKKRRMNDFTIAIHGFSANNFFSKILIHNNFIKTCGREEMKRKVRK